MSDRVIPVGGPSETLWFKSSYSGGEGNECVEVADLRPTVAIRDSKLAHGPVLAVPATAFTAFLGGLRGGAPDRTR
ncbi:DUF397 domain-containing protein [Streptomyces sp. NPDC056987]|uniref:DUF397 domain-containing protein n=1 Tax=Streptomyces sp. NPDC056987 TaxID=3345988 RepID=UPI00363750B1